MTTRGPFWRVLWAVNDRPAADLYTNASALARRMAQAIATIHDARMKLVDLLPTTSATESFHPGRRSNPTLVHHGIAKAARWHLVTERNNTAVADLYAVEPNVAAKIAEDIATEIGLPIMVLSNRQMPKSFGDHPILRSKGGHTSHGPRSNPTIRPVEGEIWTHRFTGVKCLITKVRGNMVTYREVSGEGRRFPAEPITEFLSTHKAPRSLNPKGRKGRNINAYSIAVSHGYPYIRGNGRVASDGVTWLSRATKTSAGTGPAIFVGFHPKTGKTVIEYENPSRSKKARKRRSMAKRVLWSRKVRRGRSSVQRMHAGLSHTRRFDARGFHGPARNPRGRKNPFDPLSFAIGMGAGLGGGNQLGIDEERHRRLEKLRSRRRARSRNPRGRKKVPGYTSRGARMLQRMAKEHGSPVDWAAIAPPKPQRVDTWIEPSTDAELAEDPRSPYRMVTADGSRFALSTNDAIRAQKQGLEFRPLPGRKGRKSGRKGVGRPRTAGARPNPRGSEIKRAKRTFRKWHEFGPHKITKVSGPPRVIPKTLVKLGEITSISYKSNKYAGSKDNPQGKVLEYEHETKRPRPVLAADPDGRHVHIVGGRMTITADGLVN